MQATCQTGSNNRGISLADAYCQLHSRARYASDFECRNELYWMFEKFVEGLALIFGWTPNDGMTIKRVSKLTLDLKFNPEEFVGCQHCEGVAGLHQNSGCASCRSRLIEHRSGFSLQVLLGIQDPAQLKTWHARIKFLSSIVDSWEQESAPGARSQH